MYKMLLKLLKYMYMCCCYVTSALQGHLKATLFKDSNSLYANHIEFLRYAIDVSKQHT
jgi:hypothetical protein